MAGNAHDMFAVAVYRDGSVVGHLPREIAQTCWYFLKKADSKILCKLTEKRQLSSVHGIGLVVPCVYTFTGKPKNIERLISLFL